MANSEDSGRSVSPQPPYPSAQDIYEIEDLRRQVSHLRELNTQERVILDDLSALVGRLPDWEDVPDDELPDNER